MNNSIDYFRFLLMEILMSTYQSTSLAISLNILSIRMNLNIHLIIKEKKKRGKEGWIEKM